MQNEIMVYGYARVSTGGQSVDPQVQQLRAAGAAKVFRETGGGAKTERRAGEFRLALHELQMAPEFLACPAARGGARSRQWRRFASPHPSGFDRSRIHALLRSRACLGAPPLGARQEQNPDCLPQSDRIYKSSKTCQR